MMPLMLADVGEENIIKRVGGSQEMKKHLEDMGFVAGGTVSIQDGPKEYSVVVVPHLSNGEVKEPLTDALHNVRDINKFKVRDKAFSLLLFPVYFSSVLRTAL